MKKLFAITVLMAWAMSAIAQQFDFSAVCESGQTLYYRITDEEEHTVTLTHPVTEDSPGFTGNYYEGFIKPQGEIILSSVVVYNNTYYSVTAIDDKAFWDCQNLVGDLTIPDGIESIGFFAFWGCRFLSLSIPNSVIDIAPNAFVFEESLEYIAVNEANPIYYSENNTIIRREDKTLVLGCMNTTIPNDIVIIGSYAFAKSGNGGELIIPNSVKTIEEYAFMECRFSGTLTLSESLETIGRNAFENSSFLGSLTLPNSLIEIGIGAFRYCRNLTGTLSLPSSISTINSSAFSESGFTGSLIIPNAVTYIGGGAFSGTNFSELVLGNSVDTIDAGAFENCFHLTGALSLPNSVTYIGQWAFCNTSYDIIISPNEIPPTLRFNVFYGYDPTTPVHIPFGCTEIYQNASGWNYFTNFIEDFISLSGSEWYYEILNDDGSITYQHLECVGDTLIDRAGKRPKIIVRSNTHYDRDIINEVTHEYILEEDGKVYWWNNTLQEFTTLYDYNAEIGDEWEIKVGTESITVHVDSIGIFEYGGETKKVLHISDAGNIFNGDIVVGYGHMTSFFPEKLMSRNANFIVDGLRCYWVGDALLYHNGDEDCDAIYSEIHHVDENGTNGFVVYPNPATGVLFVRLPQCDSPTATETEYHITNLMGQTLLQGKITAEIQQINIEKLSAGMYFISVGEQTVKFVVK